MNPSSFQRVLRVGLVGLSLLLVAGCDRQPTGRQRTTRPASPDAASRPAQPPASLPADTAPSADDATDVPPETSIPAEPIEPVPTTLPASTYDPNPPYTVDLHVRKPDDHQPGWLRILQLGNDKTPAGCTGIFPEQNRIEVVTDNVSQLRLHIGFLPISARGRIFLHIDQQNLELARKHRTFVYLERRSTGEWIVTRSE